MFKILFVLQKIKSYRFKTQRINFIYNFSCLPLISRLEAEVWICSLIEGE